MIKSIISIIFLVACFLWACDIEISFSPFSVRLSSWRYALALVLAVGALIFARAHGEKKGYDKAKDQVINIIREERANQQQQ